MSRRALYFATASVACSHVILIRFPFSSHIRILNEFIRKIQSFSVRLVDALEDINSFISFSFSLTRGFGSLLLYV